MNQLSLLTIKTYDLDTQNRCAKRSSRPPAPKRFSAATLPESDLGIPPYNWIPPETPPLQITQNRRKQFPLKNLPDCPSLSRLEPEGRPNEEHLARKDADLKKIPHPKSSFGYGRNLKWTFIDPVIEPETINGQVFNLITGAAIVAEWNPHSSSSGVPIQH